MMTSPEKLRRRQHILGIIVILLAIFSVLQALYFQRQRVETQNCIARNFAELSSALQARADLQERESSATEFMIVEFARYIRQRPPTEEERVARLLEIADLYERMVDDIQGDRQRNPIPPYPRGTCTVE